METPKIHAHTRFIRSSRIARNTGFSLETARNHVKAGLFGPPRFLWGEWCGEEQRYLQWLEEARVPIVLPLSKEQAA